MNLWWGIKNWLGEATAGRYFLVGQWTKFWLVGGLPFSATGGMVEFPQQGKPWSLDFSYLKLVSAIFYHFFIFHQMIALQKLWKMFFSSSKKLFSFSRYSNFRFSSSPLFSPVSHCFRDWFQKNRKVYDVILSLNKNLITRFLWYLEKEIRCDIDTLSIDGILNMEHFYVKIMQKMCTKS